MSHEKRNNMNNLSANLEQQSAFFDVEQQCAHFNSTNLEHRNHFDSCSANFEQRIHSHDFSDSLEQRNCANNFYANLEQSTHVNSSSSSCCQPLKHHGRHGEPLYKSLLRPHRCSYMDCGEGPHRPHQHECTFEAENSAAGDCLSHQFTDCTRFGFPALLENHTSMGSVSKGQSYHTFRALSTNEITLYNWYLIRCSGSHPSEIAVGGFLSSRGMDNERIETSTIVKRLEERKVLTKDGNVVNLVGPLDDYRTISNGFSLQTIHLFLSGFPHIWNLVVGMGLPVKGVGTNTVSRSRDFYGGEVTSQVSLQKDFQFKGKCMHQSSVPEGRENETVSCLEVERHHGFKFVTKELEGVETVAKLPERVVLQEQVNTLLDGKPQLSGDQPFSNVQLLHEKQDKCISPVMTSDKETELGRDFVEGKSQHEASHAQMECTAKQVMEVMGPASELENVPLESVEAAMTESRSEDVKPESVTKICIEDSIQEEKQDNQTFVESRTDANQLSDLHDNAGTVEISDIKLEIASVQSPDLSDCHRESRMAKRSKCSQNSLSRKRKVVFNIPDIMETEHPSSTSPSLKTSTKGLGRSCSLNSKGVEPVSSVKSVDIEKIMVTKTVAAKQKGKRKKKGRFLLRKYKRSTKLMVKSDICENTEDGKGEREVCDEEGLETGCKKRKITTRIRNSTDEQSGAIFSLEQPLATNKTAKGEASVTALVLEPIVNRRGETRQGINEKSCVKEAAPKKIIAKKGTGSLAKLQHTRKQTRVYDDSSQMESNDGVVSTIDDKKTETEIKDSLKVDSTRRKMREADFDIHSGTSKRRKAKPLKKIETDDPKDSTCGKETSEGHCNIEAPIECDNGPSTVASARKKFKLILPPPLPLPLVSVSKELVSKAFGLKTSRSGRLLVPPLAHWRGQSCVRDMDGGIIAIEDGSQGAMREDTGCFTFKPPIEARAKKLQKWLCETATECLTKKLKARKKASSLKRKFFPLSQS